MANGQTTTSAITVSPQLVESFSAEFNAGRMPDIMSSLGFSFREGRVLGSGGRWWAE